MLTRGISKIFCKAQESRSCSFSVLVVGLDFSRNLKNDTINASKLKQRSEKMIIEKISNQLKISKSANPIMPFFSEFFLMTPTFYFIFQYSMIFYYPNNERLLHPMLLLPSFSVCPCVYCSFSFNSLHFVHKYSSSFLVMGCFSYVFSRDYV